MSDKPSQKLMMQASYQGTGKPKYVDEQVEEANNRYYPNRGDSAPAYKFYNSRYREYR